ncbi:MAG: 3'-5' exonuclease [Candidatus Krumholzibacteriota bacterium]|nr:3'-5' exonuclease [Candidatus Krumholzibacteriota bacterium]
MAYKFIIFDVETNGLMPAFNSVLSFSGLHVSTFRDGDYRRFEVKEEFDRYYYSIEPYNPEALRVNGLTADVIKHKRGQGDNRYPSYFNQDKEVVVFCGKADLAVCHNSPFDTGFLLTAHNYEFKKNFCTMRNFTGTCAIAHKYYGMKWPKLEEAVDIICGRKNFDFHDSLSDCYAVLELLRTMANSREGSKDNAWPDKFDEIFR